MIQFASALEGLLTTDKLQFQHAPKTSGSEAAACGTVATGFPNAHIMHILKVKLNIILLIYIDKRKYPCNSIFLYIHT